MRIGFLSEKDPAMADSLSGIPFSMRNQLARRAEVVTFTPRSAMGTVRRLLAAVGLTAPAARVHGLLKSRLSRSDPKVDPSRSEEIEAALLAEASRQSRELGREIREAGIDVVFTCYSSPLLYDLDVEVPVVYYSDSTGRTIRVTYPRWKEKSEGYLNACEEFNRRALVLSDAAVLSTSEVRRSAIEDYGADPDHVFVVPLGCNVTSSHPTKGRLAKQPTRDRYELCLVGLEPERKGLDLAIDAVKVMRDRGVEAWLTYVGPVTERAKACPWVRCAGRLRLASPRDRREHQRVLTESHFFIMPSTAEAFGIAPIEAGHHGTPSIVRGVGGLPEVVLDGDTGFVMPKDAGPDAYADALIGLIDDPAEYARMCRRAEERARRELTWEAWCDRIFPIIESVVSARRDHEVRSGRGRSWNTPDEGEQ